MKVAPRRPARTRFRRATVRAGTPGAGRARAAVGVVLAVVALLLMGASAAMGAPAPVSTRPASPSTSGPASPGATVPASVSATGPTVPAAPSLSIAVDNGKQKVVVGDRLDYTVTVRNLGGSVVKNLVITQTMPVGLAFGSADRSGVARSGTVSWRTQLPARGSTTFHTSATVSATPPNLLRLASVACAATGTDAPPIVCASHSDALPAAAAAAAGAASGSTTIGRTWWYVGGAVLLAALVGVAVALLVRRRPRHRAAG